MQRLVWLIAAIAISMPCVAQSPPPRIGIDMTSTTSPLSAEQRAALETYARAYVDVLEGENLDRADRAGNALLQPLMQPRVTAVFRDEYSRILVPMLEEVLQGQVNHYAAINAMQILAQMRTREALRTAMRHASIDDEDRVPVRIWAAIAFDQSAGALLEDRLQQRAVDTATRDLARAAEIETDWLVLLRQLEALGGLGTQVARDEERDVLDTITARMASEEGPSELVHALYPAVIGLRARVIDPNVPPALLTAMGKDLAPILARILELAEEHWEEVQESEDAHSTYGNLVRVTESTIKRIDAIVAPAQARPPQTQLDESWAQRDKARFEQDVEQWMQRIESPVYTR